jgi:hypothetical protein
MSTKRSPARDGGAVGHDDYEPHLDTKSNIGFQADNNGRYVVSSRLRFIRTLGFPRKGRRNPFSAAVFALIRRELAPAPLIGGQA